MIHALDVVDDTASSTTNKDELGVEVTVIGDDDSAAAGQEGLRLCRSPSPILGNASLSTPSRAQAANSRKLMFAVCICFTFFLIQLVGGWLSHSVWECCWFRWLTLNSALSLSPITYLIQLALVADSFHMLIDCAAYSISLFALYISRQKPTHKFSFGFARAEIFGALISVILIWSLVIILSYQAALRISTPGEPINCKGVNEKWSHNPIPLSHLSQHLQWLPFLSSALLSISCKN